MKKCWSIVVVFFAVRLSAQDTCSCSHNLDLFINKVERNYAGFADKVTKVKTPRYDALTDSVRKAAQVTTDKSSCFRLLDTYRGYFQDKHLQLSGTHAPSDDGGSPVPPRTTHWTAASLEQRYRVHREELRTLEGMWSLGSYRVGIVFNDSLGVYEAIIAYSENASFTEGMVKFTVTEPKNGQCDVRYWRGDLRTMETTGTHASGHLSMKGIGTWHHVEPAPEAMDARAFELAFGDEVQWRMLDDSTLYIKLGSCDLANKAVLDSLVAANKVLLEKTPYWIVDFRGNGGGSTDVFQALLPYLYTKPMKDYGTSYRTSPENIARLKEWFGQNEGRLDKRSAKYIRGWISYGETHPDGWHVRKGGTTRYKRSLPMPQRVAILADRGTASSGESFLETARGMSDKSTIFGENSGGYMDYGELLPHDLGCDGLVAAIPTSRMDRIDHGLRYDLEGIAPDVRIGAAVQDWIAVVKDHWAR